MKLHTASETISFVNEFEEKSARFYENLSRRYPEKQDLWLACAKENRKYASQIKRAYYSVITDAIEGGYAFDLDSEEYVFEIELPEGTSYSEAVNKVLKMEEAILRFYTVAAEQSQPLMADVPRNFKLVAKKRRSRIQNLSALA